MKPVMQLGLLVLTSLILGVTALIVLQGNVIPPHEQRPRPELAGAIDFDRLFSHITPDRVAQWHRRMVRPETRLAGTAGANEVADAVEAEFQRLGLKTLVHRFPVTIPVTKQCSIKFEHGGDIPGVSMLPFWPNVVRTCTTPPEGIVGQLIDVGTGSMDQLSGIDIRGKIALVKMTPGFDWIATAKLGASAILFRESDEPRDYQCKILHFPADLPRFLVRGSAERLAGAIGERIHIRAKVDWEIQEARNVMGVLESPGVSGSTLVLLGHTDSWSVVPDLAPGYYEACSATALMETAAALADQRDGLGRNVVFCALSGRNLASEGIRQLSNVLGSQGAMKRNYRVLQATRDEAEKQLNATVGAVAAYEQVDYWNIDQARERQLWKQHGEQAEKTFARVVQQVIDEYVAVTEDQAVASKMAWVDGGRPPDGPLMEEHLIRAALVRRARTAAGADPVVLNRNFKDVLDVACGLQNAPRHLETQLPDATSGGQRLTAALHQALAEARAHANYQRDAIKVANLFVGVEDLEFVFMFPSATGQRIAFTGESALSADVERARDAIVQRWLDWRKLPSDDPSILTNYISYDKLRLIPAGHQGTADATEFGTRPFVQSSHKTFAFWGTTGPEGYQTPRDTTVALDDLANQSQLLAGMAAQMASASYVVEKSSKTAEGLWWFFDYGGEVLTRGSANSILPDRPVRDALVVLRNVTGEVFYVQKTPSGFFRFPAVAALYKRARAYGCDAYKLDAITGHIKYARDLGAAGQRLPNEMGQRTLAMGKRNRVVLPVERLDPTDIYGLVGYNSQPLTVELLNAQFRTPPVQYSISEAWEQGATVFLPPGDRFYVVLKDIVWPVRSRHLGRTGYYIMGFLLGSDPPVSSGVSIFGKSFWGEGYRAGQDRRIVFQDVDAALSVARANHERLASQQRKGLADSVTDELSTKAKALFVDGQQALNEKRYSEAYRKLARSQAISMRAYPTVKRAVADAVLGILLYMFLMVPFARFAERLFIASSDIRPRILWSFGIFLCLFFVVRFTHPAYEFIRNPVVVLVGFTIFMLSVMILGFLSGKFAQRMRELRAAGGGATEADTDVSRAGAAATAFSLGINSMRKRPVRTAYTLSTIVLISFALLCFTSPRPHLLQKQIAQGSAEFNGILLRERGDLLAARTRFGNRATIVARRAERRTTGHEITALATYRPPEGQVREAGLNGLVYLQAQEATVTDIEDVLLPGGKWFEQNDEPICYLSNVTASQLGIIPGDLEAEPVHVHVRGQRRRLMGIFDSAQLDALGDIDGESFLPELRSLLSAADIQQQRTQEAIGQPGSKQGTVRYLPAAEVAILPLDPDAGGYYDSAVVRFNDLPYGQLQESVDGHMDAAPTFFSFALDGRSFFGGKVRALGLETLVDIVVPLLVASCIVFNTMLGSVYERQKEISVYSAVGLSPRHVFFLFLAESLVYAVLGVIGGYLLGLCLQWISYQTGDSLGMAINYSSRSAIYVCFTIMFAVLASTFVPAWRAARIASPSEGASWSIPPPVAPGQLKFQLPFTFRGHDAIAVVPFLVAWFDARGEDSSGAFSATAPTLAVRWFEDTMAATVAASVWLRPYDLGVSQDVKVSVKQSAPESDLFIAELAVDLRSGSASSWQRTNMRFVTLLRRHLLSWRAVAPKTRRALFEQASRMLLGSQESRV